MREKAPALRGTEAELQESVWIEIIRRMEELYAQLADSQAEIEKHAQELSEAKELADNIIRSMGNVLIALDSNGTVTLTNDAAEHLFGFARQDLISQPLDKLLPEPAREAWRWNTVSRRVRREGAIRDDETTWQNADGLLIPVAVSGSPLRDRWGEVVGAVLVVRDLRETKRRVAEALAATVAARARARELEKANAELKRLQAELIQAAKMSSLGRLAAGVAHEVNNPLGAILLYSDLLLEDTASDDPRHANIEKIAKLSARCREIVRELLDFARPAELKERRVDVTAVLRNSLSVLEGQEAFHNIKIEWDLATELPSLVGDPAQLQQAFTNVVLNAVEAMSGSGVLGIQTAPMPRERGTDAVVVRISDTGRGIPEEDREHLFEPFFTTRDDGTGLGLAITYGIIERHNGAIEVETEVGKGTTLVLTLRSLKGADENA